jgi:hypothetical protein
MIKYDLDSANSVLTVQPESSLDKQDFVDLAKVVDPVIEANGELAGLVIEAPGFPGWDSFGAMVTHFRFIRDHEKHVKKIAVVTDSRIGDFAAHLGSHFISAKIQQFPAGQVEQARKWILDGS